MTDLTERHVPEKAIPDSLCLCSIRMEHGGIILSESEHPSCWSKTEMAFLCLIHN